MLEGSQWSILAPIECGYARGVHTAGKGANVRFNNLFVRALTALVATVLLNGSVIGAFAHAAGAHGANVATHARAWA